MTHKITAGTVEHNFDQILQRALEHKDRFIVEQNGGWGQTELSKTAPAI